MPKFKEFRVGDLFSIGNTFSFNKNALTKPKVNDAYDYVTRTSENRGVLKQTGFVNSRNLNDAGTYSLGLLQMDFYYRKNKWYAGQFVRKVTPKFKINKSVAIYMETILNKLKPTLLSRLVRDVDDAFLNARVSLPVTQDGTPDWQYMEDYVKKIEADYVKKIEADYVKKIEAYLQVLGYPDVESVRLTETNREILERHANAEVGEFRLGDLFEYIIQGKRLKKDDQLPGNVPFVMSGVTNTGIVGYISNPVREAPANSITIDIFGSAFYRNYEYGYGDDTGAYWNAEKTFSKQAMLYITTMINRALEGKYSYGKKLRASQTLGLTIELPISDNEQIDIQLIEDYMKAIEKKTVAKLVQALDTNLKAFEEVTK